MEDKINKIDIFDNEFKAIFKFHYRGSCVTLTESYKINEIINCFNLEELHKFLHTKSYDIDLNEIVFYVDYK